MATLPSQRYLIQQIDGVVILFEGGSEREIVRTPLYTPGGDVDLNGIAQAQQAVYGSELSDEDKCFAHFWYGYFYAYAGVEEDSAEDGLQECPVCHVQRDGSVITHAKGCAYPAAQA
jgi:hypothetical protein